MKAELLSASLPLMDLAEGPCWDHQNGRLYWVDITGQTVHRYDPLRQQHEHRRMPSMVGFAVTKAGGGLLVGLREGVHVLDFESGSLQKISASFAMPVGNRFNDAKCDRRGRLWCGTMNLDPHNHPPSGALYRLDGDGFKLFEKEIFISNGLGWSPDSRTMYYNDTVKQTVWQYDYDVDMGEASNRRVFLKKELPGHPDGMGVDSRGRVLTALWGGWGIEIRTPGGKLDGRIELPVPQVTSCAFGGPDLKTLFVTTAQENMKADALREAPLSGAIFAVAMDVPGLPEAPCEL